MEHAQPKTRTESKKQGKKGTGPYTAKGVRAAEARMTLAAERKAKGVAEAKT